MRWLRYLRRKRRDRDFSSEIEAYLAEEIDDNIARGMAPREAAWAAQRKFGNITGVKEEVRAMNTIGFLETLWQDLRYTIRLFRLNPGFFIVAALCLALGIGANTAIFHLLDAVRLRSLPVERPQELAEVQIADNDHCCNGNFSTRRSNFTYAQWEQIRNQQQAFSSVFAWADRQFNLAAGGEVRNAEGLWVSGEYFSGLGVPALIGRVLTPEDDRPGCGSPGAVISYAFWQREFGGSPSAIGKTIRLDRQPFQVLGVTPAYFFGVEVGRTFDVAIPLCSEPLTAGENSHTPKRNHWWLAVIGRLKPGWSVTRATAQLAATSGGVFRATVPPTYRPEMARYYVDYKLTAVPAGSGVSTLRKEYEDPLVLLLAIATLVLLIACANLTNLMLARASTREREIAIRLAIGASRRRLIRQLLSESLLLSLIGAALGLVLAQALSTYLVSFLTTTGNPLFVDLGTDWRLFGFTAGLAILTCVLVGLTPAIRATRTTPGTVMKASSRGLTAGRERFGLRRILVVSQVALSLVLLVGALLFVRSLLNLLTLDAGFRDQGLLITQMNFAALQYKPDRRAALGRELLDRIRAAPGIDYAAQTAIIPISGNFWNDRIDIRGSESLGHVSSNLNAVSPGYFRTLGTPILAGRDFDERDTVSAPKVALVNEAFGRKYLEGANPLGREIRIVTGPGEPPRSFTIVGVTRDAKYRNLREEFPPTIFADAEQNPEPGMGLTVIARSRSALGPLLSSLKTAVAQVNPGIAIQFQTLRSQIQDSLVRERLMATLSGFFGLLAAILATIGLYGVISYMVARRRNEIGIRMALGADRSSVMRMVLGEAATLLGFGFLVGAALAVVAARTASSMLYGLRPSDPLTILMAIALLGAVALPASWLPALRASRVDPMIALREE